MRVDKYWHRYRYKLPIRHAKEARMKLTLLAAFGVTAIAVATAAMSQPPPAAPSQSQAPSPQMTALHDAVLKNCAADQKKLCDGKEGKEGHDCMAANLPKASQECQAAIAKMSQMPPPPRPAG
jgi:hypothetical protein